MTMTKDQKQWALAIVAIVAICAATYLFTGCAGVPVVTDRVQGVEIVHDEVTPYNIPGTEIPVWHEVQPMPTPADPAPAPHTEDTLIGAAIRGITPWGEYLWPLLVLAFKRPRALLVGAAQKAVTGDAGGAVSALLALPGLKDTPPDIMAARLAKAEDRKQKAAIKRMASKAV